MEDKINLNDGNGLYDNVGLIDTLIVDCNELQKSLIIGQYIQFCNRLVQMVQKLSNLRDGVQNDIETMRGKIEEYKQENQKLLEQLYKAEKGGQ